MPGLMIGVEGEALPPETVDGFDPPVLLLLELSLPVFPFVDAPPEVFAADAEVVPLPSDEPTPLESFEVVSSLGVS